MVTLMPSRPSPVAPFSTLARTGLENGRRRLIRLFAPQQFELSYLSWGSRRYGEIPVVPKKSEGWHYFLVVSGRPIMILNGKKIVTEPGVLTICDPSCQIGHVDKTGRSCEILTWIWREPPMHSALIPEKQHPLRICIEQSQFRRLKQLHIQSREALSEASERNVLKLHATRLLLDLCLLEASESRRIPNTEVRIDLAIEYLRSHINEPQAYENLRDYLNISKATLYRLFHAATGKGPRAFAQEMRMQWAREKLRAANRSVKSVAYSLGYRHPPDFSRAFKQHFGTVASDENQAETTLALQD